MGVAIIAARCDLIARLAPIAGLSFGPFPGVVLTISGQVEDWLSAGPALEAEDRFKEELILARKDKYPEPNSIPGPHRSELISFHSLKGIPANQCSTGEQKALLVAILLSHAKLRKIEFGDAPLMLLDEIAAHLDGERREALFNILGSLGSQVWMTGTDLSLFSSIKSQAQFFEICDGKLS
jgi:DNA replication and repair protein RecF